VYGIVKQHNGWINLESLPGKGTTFSAYFPEATGLSEEAPALPQTTPPRSGKETVLFVDDEDLIRDLGRQCWKCTVHRATGRGREAGDRIVRDEPGRDRPGRARPHDAPSVRIGGAARDPENRSRQRIILSSGNMPSEEVPGTAFLPKPYRADMLAQAVRSALDAPPPA